MKRFLKKYWWIIAIVIIFILLQKSKNGNNGSLPEPRGVGDPMPPIKFPPIKNTNPNDVGTFDLA